MKKIILTISTLVFSILVYAQTGGKSHPADSATPATQTPVISPNPNQKKQTKPHPVAYPPTKSAPIPGNTKESNDNGHMDQGKHKGEITPDHKKEGKDSIKIKKMEE